MKSFVLTPINPKNTKECGRCRFLDWGEGDHSCNLYGGIGPGLRHTKCRRDERKVLAAIDACMAFKVKP